MSYHSTISIIDAGQNKISSSKYELFRLTNSCICRNITWLSESGRDYFMGKCVFSSGRKPDSQIIYERGVTYDKNNSCWIVRDAIEGASSCGQTLKVNFHISPSSNVICKGNTVIIKKGKQKIILSICGNGSFNVDNSWYSNQYGVKQLTKIITYTGSKSSIIFKIKAQ